MSATAEVIEMAKQAHRARLLALYENGYLDDDYAAYIMKNGDPSERVICNGDTLIDAMEDGYLLDEFIEQYVIID